ncbi:hypothetical protein CISIN_1g003368mg [Citrus sinensis]|uniref:non-specific serine/threonine protein kinase n=2 Tax=Citrus TaxID=2706 RepID=A0A067ETF5_CITSI|nr:hypothetical protein CISIN_1g003368mg [Citrus sinensis]
MITQYPEGVLNSWNDSHHFCDWEGITCSPRHRRVTVLDLKSKGLIGSLSPQIGNLSFLREIHLSNNTIQGKIPGEIGRLFRLEALYLSHNSLVGEIPGNLSYCSRLIGLYLGRNKLEGSIPSEFVSLYNLKELAIQENNLTGGIPHFLGNITSLEAISLAYNSLGGNIPSSLGQLKELKSLGLGGTIPPSIYNLSLLANFSVPENRLHGSLPPSLGLTLSNLQLFQISNNFFSGSFPLAFSNASNLQSLEILGNNFFGKLSVNFGDMKSLAYLNVAINNLGSGESDEMSFIHSLANCSNLSFLNLVANQFKGALPHSIVSGSIPSEIGKLVSLYLIEMDHNQFEGKIPEEMSRLQNLQFLNMRHNQLSGEIPSSFGNLSSLVKLILGNNNLSGVIPSSLGNLKQLALLHLFQNDLSGAIPEEIFNISHMSDSLNFARNHLVGSIPPKIGNLKVLRMFVVSSNNLSGEIPSEIGSCFYLQEIYMAENFFRGSIPSSLVSLKDLREIDLSQNNLSGKIPISLERLPLEYLNLSFNDLEGQVPTKGIFANASAISVSGNSNRLCGGIPELQLPKCPKNNSRNHKVYRGVLKVIISTCSVFSGLLLGSFFIFYWLRRRGGSGKEPSEPILRRALRKVSYESLLKATDGFSSTHLIGIGSFGSVYKGTFDRDGTIVAIKVLNLQLQGASKSFAAECRALRNIRHRNLVRVITSCSSIDFQGNDFKALVYQYMPNGSLENWLHPDAIPQTDEENDEIRNLTLLERISIAIDVASAVDYLHHHCQEPTIHCDLKPSNILLDNNLTAHVGDFGLARLRQEVPNNQSSSVGDLE